MSQQSLISRLWYKFMRMILQIIAVLMFQVRHSGRKNIPTEGSVLMVSNHQSHLDPPLVGMACGRHMNFVSRQSLFNFGPFGWLINSLNAIPIDREGIGLSGIKESLKRLKRGEMLLIFPEGTRTPDGQIKPFRPGFTSLAVRSGGDFAVAGEMVLIFPEGTRTPDGQIKPFRPGFTSLAVRSGAAILPVAIEGAYQCWPKNHTFPRPGKVRVHYGQPILPQDYKGMDDRELIVLVEKRVRQCHDEVLRELGKSTLG